MVVAPAIINLNQHHGFDIASRSHQESLLSATQPCTNVISSHPPNPGSRSLPPRSPVRSGGRALISHTLFSRPGFQPPALRTPDGSGRRTLTSHILFHCPGFQSPTPRNPDRSGRRTFNSFILFTLPRVSTSHTQESRQVGTTDIHSLTFSSIAPGFNPGEEDRTLIYAFAAFSTRRCNDLSAIFPIKIKGC